MLEEEEEEEEEEEAGNKATVLPRPGPQPSCVLYWKLVSVCVC